MRLPRVPVLFPSFLDLFAILGDDVVAHSIFCDKFEVMVKDLALSHCHHCNYFFQILPTVAQFA
jgi:hypothetical protein